MAVKPQYLLKSIPRGESTVFQEMNHSHALESWSDSKLFQDMRRVALDEDGDGLLLLLETIEDVSLARRAASFALQSCSPTFSSKMRHVMGLLQGEERQQSSEITRAKERPLDAWEAFSGSLVHHTWRCLADPAAVPSAAGSISSLNTSEASLWVSNAEAVRLERRQTDALGTGRAAARLWRAASAEPSNLPALPDSDGKEGTYRLAPRLARLASLRGAIRPSLAGDGAREDFASVAAYAAKADEVQQLAKAREAAGALRAGRAALRERASPRAALASFRRALPLAAAAGDKEAQREDLLLAGDMLRSLGRFREARDLHREYASESLATGMQQPPGSCAGPASGASPWTDRPREAAGRCEPASGWGPEGRDYWVARARAGPLSRVDWSVGAGRVQMEDVRDVAAAARAERAGELPVVYRPAARWGEG